MTINPESDLFKAILAMDSYNRGYNAGIVFGSDPKDSEETIGVTKIGDATVYDHADDAVAKAAGFYAIAYQLPDASVTISYRGTDQAVDALSYLGGAGATMTPQSTLAIQFYQTVATQLGSSDDISLTGHSLGGGLAGLASTTSNRVFSYC